MPKPLDQQTNLGEVLHEWTIQEYEQHARGLPWYVISIILGIGLVFYGILTGNFLFSLIIILFAIILFLQSHQAPPQVRFQIAELGVVIGNRFYNYSEFDSFYIIYNPPEIKTLFLETKSPFRPKIVVPFLDQDPVEIRQTLRAYVAEDTEKEDEPLGERIARNWRIH